MGCVVTPIVGRPRPLSRHRHAQTTGTCLYTLICEEPVKDLPAAVQELREAGIELLGESGPTWQHFRGPDGNVYELVAD